MPSLREWIRYRRERRANRRALNKERVGRAPGEGQEIGYMAVGKGNKSKSATGGTGGV
jgi:hypothetical protein